MMTMSAKALRPLFGSLKFRIAAIAVPVIALSVGMTVFLVTRDTSERAERTILDSALDVDTVAKTISSRLLNREQALARAAGQWPRLRVTADAGADVRTARAFLAQQAVLGVLFPQAFVASAQDGRVLATLGEGASIAPGLSLSGRPYFRQAMQGRELAVSEPGPGVDGAGEPVVLARPLRDATGAVVAVLGGVLEPQTDAVLTDSTRASTLSQDPIETVITNAAGRIVSHPDPAWLHRDVGEDPRLSAATARWRGQGAPMESQAWAWRTGGQFVAMAAVPEANWMVFRVASADLLLGGPARGRSEAIALGALVAVGGALAMLGATAWTLRPMRLLERRARRLLDESLPIDAGWPTAGGEIGRLSDVFRRVLVERAAVQRRHREQLAWSATHDPLTELINRREFEARLQARLRDRRRHMPASALFIDLDGFKAVNDGAGHAAGDAMLRQVARLLEARVRDGDAVARLGGDEFAVLLQGCDLARAEDVAEQIRSRVAGFSLPWQGLTLRVGASIGVVEIDDSLPDIAAVLAAADAACYEAKRAGRNRVRTHRPAGMAVH